MEWLCLDFRKADAEVDGCVSEFDPHPLAHLGHAHLFLIQAE